MNALDDYLTKLSENQQAIALHLDAILMENPRVTIKKRYGIPFYDRKSWICYLNAIKKDGIELAFTRGNELSNANGLLVANDRKQIMGVAIHELESIDEAAIREIIQEAILLDEHTPYASQRKKK